MAKKRKKRRNPALMAPPAPAAMELEEITELAEEELTNRLPELMEIFDEIRTDASITLGYDIQAAHPGIDKTIMHVIRQQM